MGWHTHLQENAMSKLPLLGGLVLLGAALTTTLMAQATEPPDVATELMFNRDRGFLVPGCVNHADGEDPIGYGPEGGCP